MAKFRLYIQLISAVFSNGFLKGFKLGSVYSGGTKGYCIPVMQCSSCPGSLFSCPIGMLQQNLANKNAAWYILGFIALSGALLGRLICGFLCPFGLIQDLIFKIPFVKKVKELKGEKYLRKIKIVMFWGFVIILPIIVLDEFGFGKSWFCAYVCPVGTLEAGIPLYIVNEGLRSAIGFIFAFKFIILIALVVLSLIIWRPFCRYLCPLGYVYGRCNRISVFQYKVDKDKCINCGKCQKVCKMNIDIRKDAASPDCIRCGECKLNCPVSAISSSFSFKAEDKTSKKKLDSLS